jgi:hypothetical protein
MTTLHPTTDNVQTDHERLMSLTLELACQAVSHYPRLSRAGRRELLAAYAEFAGNLRTLGITLQDEGADR